MTKQQAERIRAIQLHLRGTTSTAERTSLQFAEWIAEALEIITDCLELHDTNIKCLEDDVRRVEYR